MLPYDHEQRIFYVVCKADATLVQRLEAVVILTLQFNHCSNIVSTTCMIHRELNLLSNVEATLKQSCNLWYQRRYNFVFWLQDFTTLPKRYHTVVCFLGLVGLIPSNINNTFSLPIHSCKVQELFPCNIGFFSVYGNS